MYRYCLIRTPSYWTIVHSDLNPGLDTHRGASIVYCTCNQYNEWHLHCNEEEQDKLIVNALKYNTLAIDNFPASASFLWTLRELRKRSASLEEVEFILMEEDE